MKVTGSSCGFPVSLLASPFPFFFFFYFCFGWWWCCTSRCTKGGGSGRVDLYRSPQPDPVYVYISHFKPSHLIHVVLLLLPSATEAEHPTEIGNNILGHQFISFTVPNDLCRGNTDQRSQPLDRQDGRLELVGRAAVVCCNSCWMRSNRKSVVLFISDAVYRWWPTFIPFIQIQFTSTRIYGSLFIGIQRRGRTSIYWYVKWMEIHFHRGRESLLMGTVSKFSFFELIFIFFVTGKDD